MPASTIEGVPGNAVTPEFCTAQFKAFNDRDRFTESGGWSKMNEALRSPWVLVMSLWDDVSPDCAFKAITTYGKSSWLTSYFSL
jgi:hypothetical protein